MCSSAIEIISYFLSVLLGVRWSQTRKAPPPPDSYFRELRLRIGSIQESCGQVCENSEEPSANHNSTNRLIEPLRKTVECRALYANKDIDKSSGLQEPLEEVITKDLLHELKSAEYLESSNCPFSQFFGWLAMQLYCADLVVQ